VDLAEINTAIAKDKADGTIEVLIADDTHR